MRREPQGGLYWVELETQQRLARQYLVAFVALILLLLLIGACVGLMEPRVPARLPPPAGDDLSLTPAPDHPGYLLIHRSDLERLVDRLTEAEEQLQLLYEEHGVAVPETNQEE